MKTRQLHRSKPSMPALQLLSTILLVTLALGCQRSRITKSTTPPPEPFGAVPNARQLKQHSDREFYAFCHFTINTFTDREWGHGGESESIFNPTEFNADQIVGAVKAAGMKGFILTCKHHDGFCLWPTKTTGHSIKNSPYKNGQGDIVGEVEQACRRAGLEFAVYLSPWDRNHPAYGTPDYIPAYREQWRELLTQYGPIFEMWLDGANGGDGHYCGRVGPVERTEKMERRSIDRITYYDWPTTWAMMHELQPDGLIFSDVGPDIRWCGNERGYAPPNIRSTITFNPDEIPGQADMGRLNTGTKRGKAYVPAEVNVSIRPGWFWHARENMRVRSPENLMNIYLNSVGHGQTFLLNIAPDRRGLVHENDVDSLRRFGEHLRSTFGRNLADGAVITASNVRGGDPFYGPQRMLDADKWSAWITDDSVTNAEVVLQLKRPQTFNMVRLREDIRLGLRVEGIALDAWVDGVWKELAKAETIGACRLWRVLQTTTDKVRIRVTDAPVCPALSDFGLFLEPKLPVWVPPMSDAKPVPISKVKWATTAAAAIDGKASTDWRSPDGLPAGIVVDMGQEHSIGGFSYIPRAGTTEGVVSNYEFHVSTDGTTWKQVSAGEFGNIRANPVEQLILFNPIRARWVKFVATRVLDGDFASVAELGVLEVK